MGAKNQEFHDAVLQVSVPEEEEGTLDSAGTPIGVADNSEEGTPNNGSETTEEGSLTLVESEALTPDELLDAQIQEDMGGFRSKKVLLHSCCAPCSGAMFEEMLNLGLDVTIFFYNPNIHPKKEYEIRKEENKKYAKKFNVPFVDCDYDADNWYKRMKGLEYAPERGKRCSECFDMRMERTALYAHEHGFSVITTTNATSRWKDVNQVNQSGVKAAERYPGVEFWARNWQTDGFTKRKYEISARERFYKQEYCGCAYSLRDSNRWRKANNIGPVKIGGEKAGLGTRYFENADVDAEEENQETVDKFFFDAVQTLNDRDLEDDLLGEFSLKELYANRKKNGESANAVIDLSEDAQGGSCGGSDCTNKKFLTEVNNW